MKKKAFAILTLCISLFAAVALVGCGGSGGATGSGGGGGAEKPAVDMRTDFIWFKVEVPEGVEISGARVVPILNGLGSLKYEEMFVVYRRIAQLLAVLPGVGKTVLHHVFGAGAAPGDTGRDLHQNQSIVDERLEKG